MITNVASASVPFVHVVGPDIDRELLLTSLHQGDQVLVEINGQRLFTDNPIASEHAWEVVEVNNEFITLSHPNHEVQRLNFSDLLSTTQGSPAVFKMHGPRECPTIFVILQLISHKSDLAGLHRNKYKWWFSAEEYSEHFSDPIIKKGLLEQWCKFFQTFSEKGWGHRSYKRFALRAGIKTDTIRSFVSENWTDIDALSEDTLLNIARQLELLSTFLELSNPIQHDFTRMAEK